MKKLFLFFTLFLTIIVKNTMAQDADQAYTDTMNSIFQKVDKSKIITGLLADYGLQMTDPEAFNGVPADSNYVNMDTWKMLYAGMYSSIINGNAHLTSPDTVIANINNLSQSDTVSLAMMQWQYNKLNDNAVELGLLQVVNNQIVEVPGAASPYLTRQLFAVAPQSLYFSGNTATFVFKQSLWYTNSGKTVQKLEINFNNESGYITAGWDAPVKYAFNAAGQKTIWFRLTYTDGSSYTSHTNIAVAKGSAQMLAASLTPYSNIQTIIIPASSLHSGGKIQIAYSSSNTTGQLRKPLIVAEGFDVYGVIPGVPNTDINDFLGKLINPNSNNNYGTINLNYSGGNLMNNIDLSQYDIVYVDNNVGTDDIRRNARLFEEAIDWVNAHKAADAQPNVIMGLSMGGLVARYALRKMEQEGKNHQTWKFISVDAPHRGANVPVSVQAAVRHLEGLNLKVFFIKVLSIADVSSELRGAINLLNTKAAKQMLIYWVNSNLSYDNSEYTAFMQELDGMGFPQQCQNIAITDGGGQGAPIFAPGSGLIKLSESYTLNWLENILSSMLSGLFSITNYPQLVLNVIPGKSQIYAHLTANALPNKKATTIYEGRVYFKKTILWLVPVSVDITKKTLNSTSDMLPIDGAPGGLYDVSMMGLSNDISQFLLQPQFCFVPTVSALGLSNWKDKLTANLQNEDFYASGTSDFDRYFTPVTSELHTRLNPSAQFLYSHLTYPVFCFNPNTSSFCGINNSTVKNPYNYPLTWSVSQGYNILSSNNIGAQVSSAVVMQMGILTCNYNGLPVRKKIWATCNLAISGAATICVGTTAAYTIPNLPAGATVAWSSPAVGAGLTLTPNGNGVQAAYSGTSLSYPLNAKIIIGNDSIPLSQNIVVNSAPMIYAPATTYPNYSYETNDDFNTNNVCALEYITIQVIVDSGSSVFWQKVSGPSTVSGAVYTNNSYRFYFPSANQDAAFRVTVTNGCGTTSHTYSFHSTNCNSGGGGDCNVSSPLTYSLSPNPAKNDVDIQPNLAAPLPPCLVAASTTATAPNSNNVAAASVQTQSIKKEDAVISTVKVYTAGGVLQKTFTYAANTAQARIQLGDLPNGIYYLVISNGKQTSKQTIVVKH